MADSHAEDILLGLKKGFLEERTALQESIVEIEAQIKECKDYIESLNKKDDCDFNMFSPRSASRVYKDQVYEKKIEIEQLEERLRIAYRKLSGVTKNIDSLNELTPGDVAQTVVVPEEKSIGLSEDKNVYLKLQEDDRQRIASELHDTVLQNLALVMHNLELAEKFIDYDPIRTKLELESNRKLVKETIEEIRSTIFDLRPMQFDDFGFKKAMENQLEAYLARTNMSIKYNIDNFDSTDHLILLTIFRIVQELVVNSIKHSKGSLVSVQVLDEGSKIYIEVFDDGIGMEAESFNKTNHFGLKILQERVDSIGASIHYPAVDRGVKVVIEVPVK